MTQFNTPDAPTARAGGDDDAAVTIFSEAYRNKYEGDKPHMTAATKRAMKECLNDIGEAQYRECVAGYFASEDEWAAGHGHDAKSFMMSPDRWRNNTAAPRKGNSAAPKHPGVGPVGGPNEADMARAAEARAVARNAKEGASSLPTAV